MAQTDTENSPDLAACGRLSEQEILARGAALIERAGNPETVAGIVFYRRRRRPVVVQRTQLAVKICDTQSFKTTQGWICVPRSLCQTLRPEAIDAAIAHEIGHCAYTHTPRRMLRGAIPRMLGATARCELVSACVWVLIALIFPRACGFTTAAEHLGAAIILGQSGTYLSRGAEYRADRYAADLVCPGALTELLQELRRRSTAATGMRFVLLFVTGRATHPAFGRRIRTVARRAASTDRRHTVRTLR